MTTTNIEKPHRLNPIDIFDDVQEELRHFWTESWPFLSPRPLRRLLKAPTAFFPRVDMYEKNDNLFVKVDLPGLKKEDIQVSLDGGDLIVQGTSTEETEVKKENYYRLERAGGAFYRRLALPFEAKPGAIDANFKEGVLEVRVPKPLTAKTPEPQKVPIH